MYNFEKYLKSKKEQETFSYSIYKLLDSLKIVDITVKEAIILYNINCINSKVTPNKLRHEFNVTNVSYLLKNLVKKGYIELVKCQYDKRNKIIELTEKSKYFLSNINYI